MNTDSMIQISREIPLSDVCRTLTVKLLKLGEEEGMTVSQAAELFGVGIRNIQQLVKNHNLVSRSFDSQHLKFLKEQGAIPLKSPTANFLPRETIRQLVRPIGTPEADAIYNHLWKMADEPLEYLKTQAEVHDTNLGSIVKRLRVIVAEEQAKRASADKRAYSAMGTAGALTRKTQALTSQLTVAQTTLDTMTQKVATLETALATRPTLAPRKYRVCGVVVESSNIDTWNIDVCRQVACAIARSLTLQKHRVNSRESSEYHKQLWFAFRSNVKAGRPNSILTVEEWRGIVDNALALHAYGKTRTAFEAI